MPPGRGRRMPSALRERGRARSGRGPSSFLRAVRWARGRLAIRPPWAGEAGFLPRRGLDGRPSEDRRRRRGEARPTTAGRPAGLPGREQPAPESESTTSRTRRTGCRQSRAARLPAARTIRPPAAASASRLQSSTCQSISFAPFLALAQVDLPFRVSGSQFNLRPAHSGAFGSSTKVTSSVLPSGRESFRLAPSKPSAETETVTSVSGSMLVVR